MTELNLAAGIVVVNLRGPGNHGGVIRNPEIVSIDGCKFLTGIAHDARHSWSDGQRIHVALDEVGMMVEYKNVEEHEAKCKWARRKANVIRRIFRVK